ncbi:hypothetical protein [Desulfobulbus elongatus]|uniref:hypothetical protein n=1 Tax=Desulfobulbus elongatus TaxID=53332 RepID=UPI0004867A53|nr:hypothetical protein [Desulfobulbus elongatus]
MDIERQAIERTLHNLLYVCLYSGRWGEGIHKVMNENRNVMREIYKRPDTRSKFIWMEDVITKHDIFFESLLSALRPTFPSAGKDTHYGENGMPLTPWPGRNYGPAEIMWTETWAEIWDCQTRSLGINDFCSSVMTDPTCLKSCFRRVMKVCLWSLDIRLDENRYMLETLLANPDALEGWVQCQLEKVDWFLLDVWQALEMDEQYKKHSNWSPGFRPWPGDKQEHAEGLLRERSRQYQAKPQQVNMRNFLIQQGVIDEPRRTVGVQEHIQVGKQEEKPLPREPEAR